ncbi:MAG: thioesterase family protein [Pseudomonadota bacterium]
MITYRDTVRADWIDFNGHMRDGYYVLVVSYANDAAMQRLGLGPDYLVRTNRTLYNLESHTRYMREAHEGDAIRCDMWLADADTKRLHFAARIADEATGETLAVTEELLMHITRAGDRPRGEAFPPAVQAAVDSMREEDRGAEIPRLSTSIAIRRSSEPVH